MARKKSFFLLIIISSVLLFHSGCNLLISMIETNTLPVTPGQDPTPTPNPTNGSIPIGTSQPSPTPALSPLFYLAAEYLCNGNADDTSGYNNHGIIYGATLTIDRYSSIDKAYYFNGTGDHIDCGNGPSLNFTNAMTIVLWIRPENFESNVILSKLESPGSGYELGIYVDTLIFFNGGISVTAPLDINRLDTWFHVAVTFEAYSDENTPRLYIDGVPIGNRGQVPPLPLSNGNLYLGRSEVSSNYYEGAIDDVRIYDYVLSQEEIADVMGTIKL